MLFCLVYFNDNIYGFYSSFENGILEYLDEESTEREQYKLEPLKMTAYTELKDPSRLKLGVLIRIVCYGI